MPITKSTKKALRRSQRKAVFNLRTKRDYKKAIKDLKQVGSTSTKKTVLLKTAYSTIDKAAKKGIIHKNKAARLKSNLATQTA